ncbi:MAG: alpha/beta hydrolase [Geminicoccaceae bacterium]
MNRAPKSFVRRFEPASEAGRPPVLLLHGTGGNEDNLLPLGRMVAPGSALLSPRGKVLEHGLSRFFRRLAEGVFDEADVAERADELAGFIAEMREANGLEAPVALGFSNGANIAAALLLLRPEALAGAVLLRTTVPLSAPSKADLAGKPVLLLSGQVDPTVPADSAQHLAKLLSERGAMVDHRILPSRHDLGQGGIALAKSWFQAFKTDGAPPER